MFWKTKTAMMATAACLSASSGTSGTVAATVQFAIPPEDLGRALKDFAHATNTQVVVASELVTGKTSAGATGGLTPERALSDILTGTGLNAHLVAGAYVVRDTPSPVLADQGPPPASSAIVVTGTRIQQGAVASPIISLSQKDILRSGQTDVGDAIRSLPQDFNGGQNPGIAQGVGRTSQNITGGSSANLRGLGADATLTLLNGHRLSYGSYLQAVDMSAIPLAAVDRVDVVADGSSAIYGSDAVGGVVNILLKPDYDGVATSARFGATTDGGDEEQQYDVTGGRKWGSGGFIATYDYQRGTAIMSRERSYTARMPDGNTLLPPRTQHSLLLSGHQALGPDLTFSLDSTYNHRDQTIVLATSTTTGVRAATKDSSFSLAPSIKAHLGPQWTITASGLTGFERTHTRQYSLTNPGKAPSIECNCNQVRVAEIGAEGPLFALPGGDIRLAAGGGYRWNHFADVTNLASAAPVRGSEHSYYGYAELLAPFVSPSQRISALYRLSLDAALRYERYPGIDDVVTPKLGLIYSPSADLDLKGSWGRSFRAPTLSELYQSVSATLYPTNLIGGSRFPDGSTAILAAGGNGNLKPERATSWSTTAVLHPQVLPNSRLEITYFHVDYRDRILAPFDGAAIFNALSDPTYANYVAYAPSAAEQAAIISQSGTGLYNATSGPYDPAQTAAIVDDQYLNAATQQIRGVDLTGATRFSVGRRASVSLNANVSWLNSRQKISTTAPYTELAGTIFNPPHWRGRFVASWEDHDVTLTSAVNHVGGLTDINQTPHVRVGSQTTMDLTAHVALSARQGLAKGVSLTLSVRNALNQHPPFAAPSGGVIYYVPYDSTNYSAIGRFVGLTVAKAW
jgi:outer membrane receptor protein involved in Fe transport